MFSKLKNWLMNNDVVAQNNFRKVKIGETFFAIPFSSKGMWVVDRHNQNLCQSMTNAMAKQLAQSLNQIYK